MIEKHPLEDLHKQYLKETHYSKETNQLYDLILNQFINYLKTKNITYARTLDILAYRQHLRDRGYSTNWIYNQIAAIKSFYKYLRTNYKRLGLDDTYLYDIMATIKNSKTKTLISKNVMTPQQAKTMILWTKEHRSEIWEYRNFAIIYLMITTGLRSIEIRRAKKQDLIIKNNLWILYIREKENDSKLKYVKITKSVKEAIDAYLDLRTDTNPYLFISHSRKANTPRLSRHMITWMFKDILKKCGLGESGLTPHALRHAAATFNLMRGGSVESTKQLLRHAHINTTLIYVEHIERLKDDTENEIESFILNAKDI
ncbi:site-specific integrase [Mycoplasmatota bacterium]|nr:site-specific integrase [Mycoplasmatota bacterium]